MNNIEEFGTNIDNVIAGDVYDSRKNRYVWLMQIISFFAAVKNITLIIFRKIFKTPKKSFVQILWEMGRDENHYSGFFIDRLSKLNHHIKVDAASSMALDTMYDWDEEIRPYAGDNFSAKFERFWFENSENRRSLVNRKKMVHTLLVFMIDSFEHESEVRIISVASGSARAVIEAIQVCKHDNVKVVLIDRDPKAIENAKHNVAKAGLQAHFEYVCASKSKICDIAADFSPHIVEMVGLLDYLTVDEGAVYARKVKDVLAKDGFFLTGNIHPNPEKIFLDWGLLWPMIYKTKRELELVAKQAQFERYVAISEPLNVHGLLIAA